MESHSLAVIDEHEIRTAHERTRILSTKKRHFFVKLLTVQNIVPRLSVPG